MLLNMNFIHFLIFILLNLFYTVVIFPPNIKFLISYICGSCFLSFSRCKNLWGMWSSSDTLTWRNISDIYFLMIIIYCLNIISIPGNGFNKFDPVSSYPLKLIVIVFTGTLNVILTISVFFLSRYSVFHYVFTRGIGHACIFIYFYCVNLL
jgi:hypothetical protein